ncbi:MAG: GNAT family N-acetyltransferase [Planctomycetaceae bacterium]|nr:GNAT family N-acetyltransferase [Planctomycetaceae bacterium]
MPVEFVEIRTREEFLTLEQEWKQLLAESHLPTPFLSHEWLSAWWASFGADSSITVIVGREEDRLVFALPLKEQVEAMGPVRLRVLSSLTNSHSFRFHYLMPLSRASLLHEFFAYVKRRAAQWHYVLLSYVPLDGPGTTLWLEAAQQAGLLSYAKTTFPSAYLPITGRWEQHEQRLKKSITKTIRRQRKRLQEIGDVQLETLTEQDAVQQALPEAFDIETRSWKSEHGTTIASRKELSGFYQQVAQAAAQRGWMRLSFLNVGGRRIAFEYALEYRECFSSIKIGYDAEEFRVYSVGRLLVQASIQQCFDRGLAEYDFVGGVSPAQADWEPQTRRIGWLYVYNNSALAKMHAGVEFTAKPLVKRLIRRHQDHVESSERDSGD